MKKIEESPKFVHLHLHSDFSCLDGYGTIAEYAKKAKKNNMGYLCVTDHGMGAAYPRMIEECKKYDLKPVYGCEIYINNYHGLVSQFKDLSVEDKERARKNYHQILIAKNEIGYRNLVKIISDSWINGFYYKPRISRQFIFDHSEGLIATSGCMASEFCQLIMKEKIDECKDLMRQYKEVFGDDFYIELQMINMDEQDELNKTLIRLADELDISDHLVLTNDVHYCEKKDAHNQKIMLLLNSKSTLNSEDGWEFHTQDLWFKKPEEIHKLWTDKYSDMIPEPEFKQAIANTVNICKKCNVQIDTSPKFPEVDNANEILLDKALTAMKKMDLYDKKEYRDRLIVEYNLIHDKGYESYFLLVEEIINWTKSQGWSVGPGRGCFTPQSLVKTPSALISIQDINIGDQVISHDGTFNRVLDKFKYQVDEEIIEIITENGDIINCTFDHLILVLRDNKEQWIQANLLNEKDEIVQVWDMGPWRIFFRKFYVYNSHIFSKLRNIIYGYRRFIKARF